MSVSCHRCSKENPEDVRFCLGCGTDLHGRNNARSTIGHPPPLVGPPWLQPPPLPPPLGAPRPSAPGPASLVLPGGPPSPWMLAPITASTEGDIGQGIAVRLAAEDMVLPRLPTDVVLPRLRTFADGSDGGDLEFSQVVDLSPGMAMWHTIRAHGEILSRLGTQNPFRNYGYVPPEDVRALARVIAGSAFPDLPEPAWTGFRGVHPVGPLQFTVRANGVERSVLQHGDRNYEGTELEAILNKFNWVLRRAKRDPNAW